jgi:AcrR family transcriptional regulator
MGEARKAEGPGKGAGAPDVAVRERLLLSATDLFTRKGYAGTTVREIVESAGVTKPVLYYYFNNKEGIYIDLMREGFSRFDSLLYATMEEPGSAAEKLKRLSARTFDIFLEHIGVARLMYAIYYGPPQGAPFFDFEAYHLKFRNAVRRLVDEGMRSGEFRRGNAEDMTWALIGAVNVAMEAQLCHSELGLDRNRLDRVLDVIFAGIATGNRKGTGKGGRR